MSRVMSIAIIFEGLHMALEPTCYESNKCRCDALRLSEPSVGSLWSRVRISTGDSPAVSSSVEASLRASRRTACTLVPAGSPGLAVVRASAKRQWSRLETLVVSRAAALCSKNSSCVPIGRL